ncbi:acyl-protein thioesterase [Colletotrichum abscissum]|uniref:Acyl-protein thioesterase n=1 Tax=Colletotrichum abscissum TaxID=1671311 RepID=A0A9Q0B9Z6_9PEZI|nr:acyl-protein thioesterase [Colletotrichum abscissum]KAI3557867.1 acyl-protein thioesterase [Colletotrichum abscissum]KAK1510055.1 acyl-protein thioesterase [Colletotrichum abscissum]
MSSPLIYHQPSTAHTHTVVFLHGRGDNAKNFMQSLNYSSDSQDRTLVDAFPSFRWVFPQAKTGKAMALGDRVSQWFDIWNVNNFADHEEHQAEGLRDSVAAIREILTTEAELLGGKWNRIILAGISQGAAAGVHTLLNLRLPPGHSRLGAFVGFSCRMPFPGRNLNDTRAILGLEDVPEGCALLEHTPILLEHCVDDPLVLVSNGRILRDTLGRFGAQVEWKEYQEGGHWFNSPSGMDDVVQFLNSHLSE